MDNISLVWGNTAMPNMVDFMKKAEEKYTEIMETQPAQNELAKRLKWEIDCSCDRYYQALKGWGQDVSELKQALACAERSVACQKVEIDNLKKRDEDAMKMTMEQNEKFMDEIKERDITIEALEKEAMKAEMKITIISQECHELKEEVVSWSNPLYEYNDGDNVIACIEELETARDDNAEEAEKWEEKCEELVKEPEKLQVEITATRCSIQRLKEEKEALKKEYTYFYEGIKSNLYEGNPPPCTDNIDHLVDVVGDIVGENTRLKKTIKETMRSMGHSVSDSEDSEEDERIMADGETMDNL
jgi:regulator of replication initiation timing